MTLLYFAIIAKFFLRFKSRQRLLLSMMRARSVQIVSSTSDVKEGRYEALLAFFLAGCGADSGWTADAA